MSFIRSLATTITLLSLAVPGLAFAQEERPGRPANCLLVVDAQEIIKGRCLFTPLDRDGSFQIQSGNGKFFATVQVQHKGVGDGYWNEDPYAGHAHTPLGTLHPEEGCWVNDSASVCAY